MPANTFIATALAVARAGATPVLVDFDEATQLIDAEQRRPPRSRRGRRRSCPCTCSARWPTSRRSPSAAAAVIVEDAAQSQGARRNGAPGRASAATSFYPGKNLGAYGDAGAVVTERRRRSPRALRNLRNYGSDVKYHHPEIGLQLAPRHAPGRRPEREAQAAGAVERAAAAPRPPATTSCSAATTGSRCRSRAPGQRARLAPLRHPRRRPRRRAGAGCTRPASAPASTTRCRSTCRAPSRTSATAAAPSRSPRRSPTRSSRCRCSRRSPPTSSSTSPRSCRPPC